MYQYSQVIPGDIELLANLIFVSIFQEYRPQNPAVLFRQLIKDAADQGFPLLRDGFTFRIHVMIHHFVGILRHSRMTGGRAEKLHHYIDGDRMNIGA